MTARAPLDLIARDAVDGEVSDILADRGTWKLILVRVAGHPKPQKWMGVMPPVERGTRVQATGVYEVDKRGGRGRSEQVFRVETLVETVDRTESGICLYLGSGAIPGIKEGLAKRIVQRFGDATLEILDKSPDRIAEVPGITPKMAEEVAKAWTDKRMLAAVMTFLMENGLTTRLAEKIVDQYGKRAREIVETDPYRLATDIDGIGFATADTIAQKLGLPRDSEARAGAALMQVLSDHTGDGHCYSVWEDLVSQAAKLIEVDIAIVRRALNTLVSPGPTRRAEHATIGGVEMVFLPRLARAERMVARRLVEIAKSPVAPPIQPLPPPKGKDPVPPSPPLDPAAAIQAFEQEAKITLAPAQREAVIAATTRKVTVITGGPGVGKSAVTRAVVLAFQVAEIEVILCAPTGRAAKRLGEATGAPAATIHRTLGYNPQLGGFAHNEDNPLDCGAIVVDEHSMTDVQLTADLLEAVPNGARLIIVGDVDQLPSVGPGAVLRDMIESGLAHVVRLTQIFRQAKGSQIVEQAHRINRGEMPVSAPAGAGGEFYIVPRTEQEEAADVVVEMVTTRIPNRFQIQPPNIQVLTPMHKGAAGTIELNKRLQAALNPPGPPELVRGERVLRVGDRVIQKKNDNSREVYNGDIGVILSVTPDAAKDDTMAVLQVDDRQVPYTSKELQHIDLAYAISIHRAQGGQAEAVVHLLLKAHWMMLSRNLLYTGVTRGKKLVVLVADPKAIKQALSERRKVERRTALAHRIRVAGANHVPASTPPRAVAGEELKGVVEREGFVFFHSGWPSQWHPSPLEIEGVRYTCAEQFMMAEKARLFGDHGALARIMASANPREQKAIGRQVKGFDEAIWRAACRGMVFQGTMAKFKQNADLRTLLIATGDKILAEASPTDLLWGIGLDVHDPRVTTPAQWRGKNWLGEALMEARRELARASVPLSPASALQELRTGAL